ncbi:uncharacterized protein EI90DRAFT_801842 [Cantharellus anzutake]|uniref:uncharacterized protein n=1 Tax=Cantharellus anzutake TaxID=1750568 RepID=UPI001903B4C2|nr:uncharacterized protein EI90DRAFT_801842 [Cantharellus anzutake]KAF8342897.1 hypothetical protein EI90DRAFT_801842 [Cantharellus anzutake]
MRLSDITDALFKWRKRSVSSVARLETTPAASLKTHPSTMPPNNAPKLPALPGSDLSYFPASSNSGRSLAPSKSVPVGRRRTQGRRRVVTSTTMRGLADLWDPYSPSPPPLRVKLPENSVVSRSNPSLSGNSQRNGMTSSSYSESSCSTYTHNVPPTPVLHNVLAEPMIASPNQSTPALSFTMPLINVHPPTSPPKDDKHVRAQKQTSLPRHVTRPPAGKPPESQRYLPPKMVELEKSTETEQHDGNPFGQVLMDYMVNGSVEESVNSRETHDRSPPPPALTPSILSAYFRSPSEYDASRPASTTSSYPVTEHDEDFRTSSMMPRSPPSKSQMILRMEARRKNMNKRFGMDVESRMNTCHLESSVFLQ